MVKRRLKCSDCGVLTREVNVPETWCVVPPGWDAMFEEGEIPTIYCPKCSKKAGGY